MSSRDMTINQIKAADNNFSANHTIKVRGFNDGGKRKPRSKSKITLASVNSKIDKLAEIVKDGFARQELFNQYVVDQFKKQEQFNQFIIDQFKKHK